MVIDDNLISELTVQSAQVCEMIGPWIKWLASEFSQLLYDRKRQLPHKSTRVDEPYFYWAVASQHQNFSDLNNALREQFNNCLESVVKTRADMRVIKLKCWDYNDDDLVAGSRFTVRGLYTYWEVLDSSLQFNITKRKFYLMNGKGKKTSQDEWQNIKSGSAKVPEDSRIGPFNTSSRMKEDDMMQSFFRRHHQDRFHWSRKKRAQNTLFIRKPFSASTYSLV